MHLDDSLPAASRDAIDRFVDALWIEDGLAPLTLAAYRRDLSLFAGWLESTSERSLDEATEVDLRSYAAQRHADPVAAEPFRHAECGHAAVNECLPGVLRFEHAVLPEYRPDDVGDGLLALVEGEIHPILLDRSDSNRGAQASAPV